MIDLRLGDARELAQQLGTGTVQTIVTSPPYWGLRDYGTAKWQGGDAECDHATGRFTTPVSEKQRSNNGSGTVQAREICPKCGATRVDSQLGLERTPEEYVCHLVELFRELRRALKDDGTVWINLGDSYATNGSKSLGNSYGASPTSTLTTGTRQARREWDAAQTGVGKYIETETGLKQKDLVGIPWRVAFALQADGWYLRSDIIWAKPNPMPESVTDRPTKSHEYIFLLSKSAKYYYDADAVKEQASGGRERFGGHSVKGADDSRNDGNRKDDTVVSTRNRRSVWTIATKPFRLAHFATFPEALIEPCILAGSRVGDIVLDPFNGAGTTGVVAKKHGRRYIGFELNPEYLGMAERRIMETPTALPLADGLRVP